MLDVYYVEGIKHILLSIGQLIQKGYRVYMEDNQYVIKDMCPRNQMIEKVPMKRNHLFPLRITPNMKEKENTGAAFKVESKEEDKHCDQEEIENTGIQTAFQPEVEDESWLWHFIFGILNFGGMKLLHTNNMVKGLTLINKLERVCEGYIFGKQQ